jgi:RNA polymerase sigma factor (sigma-70 family)
LHEQHLIAGLKEGHEQAFEELVNLYKDRIYNTSIGFVQNGPDAEEITQDVFIKVFENINGFKGESKLGTWLYRIAVTQSLDFLRKKRRRKRSGFLLSLFNRPEAEAQDFFHPGIKAEQKENAALLFQAIRQLPEQQQAAFLLQKTEGLNHQEIAAVLKTSVSAVESLLHRAKTNLRKLLTEHYKS